MLYAKGTRVRLRHSAERGIVTEILDKDLLMVRLEGEDMEIPVFVEDLERQAEETGSGTKAKIISKYTPEDPSAPEPVVESQYAILKSFGIQLAFDPNPGATAFRIFLLNDTNEAFIFHFSLVSAGKLLIEKHGKIPEVSTVELGEMLLDVLNEQPELELRCTRITTEGLAAEIAKSLKIKPKPFFSKTMTAPMLNRQVHLYRIFDRREWQADNTPTPEKEDLKTYTLRKAKPAKRTLGNLRNIAHEVEELAHFIPEIDLHIENLTEKHKKLSNADILRIQLSHFERFMEKAVQVGAERVFIIHGLGKGKLRDVIAGRLMQMEEVKTFNNNYHPRYGFGATEVILR